jgi:arylsulfatase A-like enzyme
MKKHFLHLAFLFQLGLQSTCIAQQATKPNIIVIMTDDQGYGDFGFTGNPYVKTPHLDRLAKNSVSLTNFHTSPVCAPTRASLLTGRYALRTGIHDTYNNGSIMATEEVTLAEILLAQGYTTGMVGKWHLGDNYPYRPSDQGFLYSLMHAGGGIGQPADIMENLERTDSAYFDPVLLENDVKVKKRGYCTDVFTDQALKFVQENKSKPFFLYVSYNAAHTPLQLPEKYEELYQDLKFDGAFDKQADKAWSKMSEKDKADARKVYGMVTNIDDNVGRLLTELQKQKLDNNTIIIFLTDNGNEQLRFNTGFRGLKSSVYEGGSRVPFLISGAGIPKEARTISTFTAHVDVLPTLLDMLKLPIPKDVKSDGFSFYPQLLGKKKERPNRLFYSSWNRGWPEPYRNAALYRGDYKLVAINAHEERPESFELYHLPSDPFEAKNLSSSHPELVSLLKQKMDSLYTEITSSPYLSPRRLVIGSDKENPATLSRSDWSAASLFNWRSDQATGYWTIYIEQDGYYHFKPISMAPLPAGTRVTVRFDQFQRSLLTQQETRFPAVKNIYLKKGNYNLETWFENSKGIASGPFYLEAWRGQKE